MNILLNGFNTRKKYIEILTIIVMCIVVIVVYLQKDRTYYQVYLNDKPLAIVNNVDDAYDAYDAAKSKYIFQSNQTELMNSLPSQMIYIDRISASITEVNSVEKQELTDDIYSEFVKDRPVMVGGYSEIITEKQDYYAAVICTEDPDLYSDETIVVCEGSSGTIQTKTIVNYINGEETERTIIETNVVKEAVPREIHKGIKKRPSYILPVNGYRITSGFGSRWGEFHKGVDMSVVSGTDVMASAPGVVIQSGWNGSYGISVYIEHANGVVTRYGHLSKTNVNVGDTVSQGDVIALSGNTGNSTGPHLHFEIRINGEAVNPANYVDEL